MPEHTNYNTNLTTKNENKNHKIRNIQKTFKKYLEIQKIAP
jgi:hypothetical protein